MNPWFDHIPELVRGFGGVSITALNGSFFFNGTPLKLVGPGHYMAKIDINGQQVIFPPVTPTNQPYEYSF